MVMRHRELSTSRTLLVKMGEADTRGAGAGYNVFDDQFRMVGDIVRLKKPSVSRETLRIIAGGLSVPKLTTRVVGPLRVTVQSEQSELVAAIGQTLVSGNVTNPGVGTSTRSGETTPQFLVRETADGISGETSITLTLVDGVITEYDPQEVGAGELATTVFTMETTKLYGTLNKRVVTGSPTISGPGAVSEANADLLINFETGKVWAHGYEVTKDEHARLGIT